MRRDIALRRQGLLSDIQLVTALGAGSCREMLAEPTSGSMDASEAPAPDDGTSLDHEASKVEAGVSVERDAPEAERGASSERKASATKPTAAKHQRQPNTSARRPPATKKTAAAAAAAIDRKLRAHDLSLGEEAWQSSQMAAREHSNKKRPLRIPPDATMAVVDGFLEGEVLACFAPRAQARLNATSLAALLRDYY